MKKKSVFVCFNLYTDGTVYSYILFRKQTRKFDGNARGKHKG
jgi:hypothetical protein